MERVNGHPVFSLGWSVGVLAYKLGEPEATLRALAPLALSAAYHLGLFAADTTVDLPHSKEAARNIGMGLRNLFSEENLNERGQAPPGDLDRRAIGVGIVRLDNLLTAELGRCDLYFVSKKRAWDMTRLIFSAVDALPKSAIEMMTETAIFDFNEAGRCIAFDLPTASGFHVFRSVEAVVLQYFPVLGIDPPENRNLGAYIKALKAHGVDEKIIWMLEHLKNYYRNELIHSEWTLTEDDAANLFQIASSAVPAMTTDLRSRGAAGSPSSRS